MMASFLYARPANLLELPHTFLYLVPLTLGNARDEYRERNGIGRSAFNDLPRRWVNESDRLWRKTGAK
jgi:hypothetical protein